MRRVIVLLFAIALLPGIAATCTTPATQKSPSGPWVGEVTNDGDAVMWRSIVYGEITDGTGRVQAIAATTCPARVAPGETAAWEIASDGYDLVPPMTGVFRHDSSQGESSPLASGLRARIEDTDPARGVTIGTIANRTPDAIGGITLCAIMRDPSGALVGVRHSQVVPSQLAPFTSTTAVLYFGPMPSGVTLDLEPQGQKLCCGPGVLPASSFRETSRSVGVARFADHPAVTHGLTIVGEVTGLRNDDLFNTIASAHINGQPLYRVDGITAGCLGLIPRGTTVPVKFTLPIPPETAGSIRYVIDGIEGRSDFLDRTLVPLPVKNIQRDGESVSGEIVNHTALNLKVRHACVTASENGRLVGVGSVGDQPILAPGERVRVGDVVSYIGNPDAFDILAYGEPWPDIVFPTP